ncbi:PREDICTED: rab9 effector protein with kelch motifs-like [Nanorana parkeri]|uniref:rab9 effector protein with kelch motifs-like n=1 Tax=Nanorana parkeri TaxID=125878 RepID=UPI000854C0CB|nr:PREDICTED: rab9 effector protein with kelch motifs-like [Nanorana parkeri]
MSLSMSSMGRAEARKALDEGAWFNCGGCFGAGQCLIWREAARCRRYSETMEGLPEFYVLCNTQEPPVRLQRLPSASQESFLLSAPVLPSSSSQLLLFSVGDWSRLSHDSKFKVQLEAIGGKKISLGTLSRESRCFVWECGSSDDLTCKLDGSELHVTMLMQGQINFKNNGPNQESKKRKRLKVEAENICPNKGLDKGDAAKQKNKNSKSAPLTKPTGLVKATSGISGVPSGRWGHALCPADSETVILIGGQGTRMQFCKDSMWKLNTETDTWSPVEAVADGSTPEARTGHTTVFDPESRRIYVFGGSKNKKWFNDVHILDTEAWRWRSVEAQGKVPPLSYHSCSLFQGELFVYGGVFPRPNPQPDGCSDSVYIFDPQHEIWYQPIVLGKKPLARSGHTASLLNRELYIFGGWDTPVCYNDLFLLDLGLMEFSPVEVNGTSPSPRCWHSAASVSETSFLIHGGYDGNRALNDTHMFNTVTKTWTALVHKSLPCLPRAGYTMLTLPGVKEENKDCTPQELLMFGGGDNEGHFYCDTVRLRITDIVDL